ncbi:MAG: iron chelate uptake ABC transporter family permease subunit [Bacteroidia bacterium]
MKEIFSQFFSFNDPSVNTVLLGVCLLSINCALTGTFIYLKKNAILGDVISHAVLPGICIAFILHGEKNMPVLLTGAFVTGFLAAWLNNYIPKISVIKPDTASALILSVFFGTGTILLTIIQKTGNAAQSGVDSFIMGKAAGITQGDISFLAMVLVITVALILIFRRGLLLYCFDEEFATAAGFQAKFYRFLISFLTVLSVTAGIQAAGVLLVAGLMIIPVVAANFWVRRINIILILASIFGIISATGGSFISYIKPGIPTGPWIIIVNAVFAFISILFGIKGGVLGRLLADFKRYLKSREENYLKYLYKLSEDNPRFHIKASLKNLIIKGSVLGFINGFVFIKKGRIYLTPKGFEIAQQVVRRHRLWESYLSNIMHLQPDHLHENAELMEHYITDEIEEELQKLLGKPVMDPHHKLIPYQK